ncbi:TRAP transporter small permease [Pacificibacter marinus]|uniref:TRAP transporter small permease protein n=1 Tax=Pacificibacter marinus TaxID=658057 RepID=A0A1Y5RCZ2_9RHOB|nr:TRAP transporter small permease [Pacificibacter marinus]SEK23137.1 TRAP-type C4-dicarboxylate transport system, small permease component [Pacificibacter marinus]SLN14563.1 2,3-diketo-L-gulonate TRAP transporter small permease protein YiaM [Pacificibacter marinus]
MSGLKSLIVRSETALTVVQRASIFTASVALVVLVATFGWLVFGRYVLNVTPTWVEQLALLLICYIAFLGAAAGVKEDTHLGVTLFRDMLPDSAQKVVIIGIDLILAIFGAVMFVAGIALMKFGWDSFLPMLNIPESFRTLAITLCGALIVLNAGIRGLIRIVTFSEWHPNPILQES